MRGITETMALIVFIALLACASAARPPAAAPQAARAPQAALAPQAAPSIDLLSIKTCAMPCQKQGAPYSQECLQNPLVDCSDSGNEKCPSCGLWRHNAKTFPKEVFHITKPQSAHQLVVPTHPCRGVENWYLPSVGEAIWDTAAATRLDALKAGMAINPTNRRTMAQMHVHVATVQPNLMAVLKEVATHNNTSWTFIDCAAGKATKCRYSTAQTSMRVKYVRNTGPPSSISPFETVYGTKPIPQAQTQERGMLVASPTADGYVILEVNDRQVECLLTCGTECEGRC